jgi:hypothetical protein
MPAVVVRTANYGTIDNTVKRNMDLMKKNVTFDAEMSQVEEMIEAHQFNDAKAKLKDMQSKYKDDNELSGIIANCNYIEVIYHKPEFKKNVTWAKSPGDIFSSIAGTIGSACKASAQLPIPGKVVAEFSNNNREALRRSVSYTEKCSGIYETNRVYVLDGRKEPFGGRP